MTLKCIMILGDCLEVMPTLSKASVSMCFADLPYGKVTANKWDNDFSVTRLWDAMLPVSADNGAMLLTATLPFAARLIMSRPDLFRYDLVWSKTSGGDFLNATYKPMRSHENILVFSRATANAQSSKRMIYNKQMRGGFSPYLSKSVGVKHSSNYNHTRGISRVRSASINGERNPVTVLHFSSTGQRIHPTQKPVALLDWLIRTYSNPGDNALDPVAGSFTTCVSACLNGRSSVGTERDVGYFEAGVERVRKTCVDQKLDVDIEVRR